MDNMLESPTRSRLETRRSYDRISRWYDLVQGYWERAPRRAGLALLDVQAGERVLEIGPGTGSVLAELVRAAGPGGQVCGLDLSPGMLRRSQERFARRAQAVPLLACGDAVCLPFPPGTFDAVFLSFTLELFAPCEIPRVLDECRRVLGTAGRLAVVAMALPATALAAYRPSLTSRIYTWARRRFPAVVDCRPVDIRSLLEAGGFRVEQSQTMDLWGMPVSAARAR
jgi:demethylmenaquinone methyltransferase/2-methoxy-6-polyprenyl-1,4-benzoquinol methylase